LTEPALDAAATDGHLDVGERLRAIRLLRRLTLREVADAAGVSESFVSQLERGRSSASVATLQRLAAALGIEISDLFADERPSGPRILRQQERQLLEWGHLGRKALLTPKPFHSLEVVAAAFDPGGSTGDEPYTHGDSEELLLVLAGRVHLQLGRELLDLSQGDSVNYRSSTPHRVSNPGEAAAEVLFVISPPSY
jgi:transcriptional regulator with XRE-family HTH domain